MCPMHDLVLPGMQDSKSYFTPAGRVVQATDDIIQTTPDSARTLAFPETEALLSSFARRHPEVLVVDPPAALHQVSHL